MRTKKQERDRKAARREKRREVGQLKDKPAAEPLDFERPPPGDPMAWLKTYLGEAFVQPFGKVHHDIKDAFCHSLETGGNSVVLAPRGTGKSTEINGLTLWALLEGLTLFPVVIPWDAKARMRALRFWKTQLCFNERLHRDYPDATAVFKESRGIGNRLTALTQGNEATGAMLAISEGIIVLPHGLGAIGSATINGNPRGMNYASIDGRVIRPTLAIIDDPQDRETAKSQQLVAQTIETIDGDIAGMAGPNSRMPIIMPATVIEKDDVAEHYSKHPNWRVVRVGQITTWPDGWEDEKSECRKLWAECDEVRKDEGDAKAIAFYADHKDAMTRGMSVSWDSRFDAARGQPDAFYSAIIDFFVMGESAFMAERQNEPIKRGIDVYSLTPDTVLSRTVDRNPFEVPAWAEFICAASDINPSYAISSVLYAFGRDRTAACLWYGKYDGPPLPTTDDMSKTQQEQCVYGALWRHGEQMLNHKTHGKQWVIDGGGAQSNAVKRFAVEWNRAHPQMQVVVAYGRSGKSARVSARNETIRKRGQDGSWLLCREKDSVYGWVEWVLWNADYWRETMQRAFTADTGAPGGATLPRGHNREYAEHLCREKLMWKGEVNGRMCFDFQKAPGRNDFADATNMAFMLSDINGIGETGEVKQKPKAFAFVARPSQRR